MPMARLRSTSGNVVEHPAGAEPRDRLGRLGYRPGDFLRLERDHGSVALLEIQEW